MDASCGPSTPLSALQKHAGADRSLQQDRFASSSSSSSSSAAGFRSRDQQHDGQAQAIDAQFSSFVAPQALNPELVAREFSHLSISQQQQQQRHLQAIFEQEQAQFHHHQQQHPQQSMESWHQDFMQFLEQPAPAALSQQQPIITSQPPMTTPYMPTFSGMPTTGVFNNFAYNNTEHVYEPAHLQQQQQQQQKVFDDAFDQIEQETATTTTTSPQTVQDEPKQTTKPEVDDDDGLSAVAGGLLQSLRDNQSQKFKESTFLALMRRLRDKEVVVQGNKMVESIADPAAANEKMGMEGMEAGADYMPFKAAEETGREAGAQGFRRGAWEESF